MLQLKVAAVWLVPLLYVQEVSCSNLNPGTEVFHCFIQSFKTSACDGIVPHIVPQSFNLYPFSLID
jgi:hypothetical protein